MMMLFIAGQSIMVNSSSDAVEPVAARRGRGFFFAPRVDFFLLLGLGVVLTSVESIVCTIVNTSADLPYLTSTMTGA